MWVITAITGVGMITTTASALQSDDHHDEITVGTFWWFTYAGISCFLVLFGGLMSGLSLGLMSLGLVDLEIIQQSGTPTEMKQAAAIHPLLQKQHQLLVSLLLCNSCANAALPIFLDKIFNPVLAIALSVTFLLVFGEVIPQALCTRYRLAVGANFLWLVHVLMMICYPIAYPMGKVLDWLLGHKVLFRRAQLKALVSFHGKEAGKGGELTHDETTIISGALDLTGKTVEEAMTSFESVFSLDINTKLNREAIQSIHVRGHTRIPIYSGNPRNLIGLLLLKSILAAESNEETPISDIPLRKLLRVPSSMPLYDMLHVFQKGLSHMAVVMRVKGTTNSLTCDEVKPNESEEFSRDLKVTTPLIPKVDEESESTMEEVEMIPRSDIKNQQISYSLTKNGLQSSLEDIEDGEVIGIITLDDVLEQLLQEEIIDETDEFYVVQNRKRVPATAAAAAAAAAASTLARALILHDPHL